MYIDRSIGAGEGLATIEYGQLLIDTDCPLVVYGRVEGAQPRAQGTGARPVAGVRQVSTADNQLALMECAGRVPDCRQLDPPVIRETVRRRQHAGKTHGTIAQYSQYAPCRIGEGPRYRRRRPLSLDRPVVV